MVGRDESIIKLRKEGNSYNAIANKMNISYDTVRHVCRKHGLTGFSSKGLNQSLLDRELSFVSRFNERFGGKFEYAGGFNGSENPVNVKCKVCKGVFERNARMLRNPKPIKCTNCLEKAKNAREFIKEETVKIKNEINIMLSEINEREKLRYNYKLNICKECDEIFESSRIRVYCSSNCSNRFTRRLKDAKRRKAKSSNGIAEDITLDRLINRDHNTCHICKLKCDRDDHKVTVEGYFIAGYDYPSIDHVIPISKGGTHTWSNVKLAHFYCNTIKGDSTDVVKQLSIL